MKCALIFVILYLDCARSDEDSVSVVTNIGLVRGLRREFTAFLGVPYGEVDEKEPFGAAKPHPHFETPYSAFKDPPICPQIVDGIPQGNIHCLHLNIYTPNNVQPNSTLPVMVYIHGGAFVEGNGNLRTYSPTFLVRHNVILVTVNYRLGPYGFLCLPQLGYSNQGLKDIVLALKWIKGHINSFGGDEENILLFGHSSGSATAEFVLLYNDDNVFNKVILQSAHIASPYMATGAANEAFVATIAERLSINKDLKIEDTIKKLSEINTDLVINGSKTYEFRPCIDDILITRTLKQVNVKDKSIIVGTTSEEMLYFYKGDDANYLSKFKEDLNKGFLDLSEEDIDTVKNFYLNNDIKENAVDFGTDYVFTYPAERAVRFYSASNATVYRYVLSHDGGHNFMKLRDNIKAAGAAHGDELGYLFRGNIDTAPFNHIDGVVSTVMTEMWTNFAKYGNPTPEVTTHIPHLWPRVDNDSTYYMNISYASNFSIQEQPYHDRMVFWEAFYRMHGRQSKGFNFGEEFTRNMDSSDLSQDVMRKMREFK